jgi:hypothetical protein
MDDIALFPRLQRPLNPLNDIQHLCQQWDDAWANLSTCSVLKDDTMDSSKHSRHDSSYRQIWALVYLPSTHNHTALLETVEECLIDLLKLVPPPHIAMGEDGFRLIRFNSTARNGEISVTLTNKSLGEVGDNYSAVSYCWGLPTQPQRFMIVNGRPMVIFDTLLTLLSQFRMFASGYYWMDAICIRQDDISEKNRQIPLMTRIYSTPRTVDIWLGPEEDDSAHVLELAHRPSVDLQASVRFVQGTAHFLRRKRFERL